jgi:DMSO/TMAO reductase YedYZ molybdopterin-dependent catalytic subunit
VSSRPEHPEVTIGGEVAQPRTFGLDELRALAGTEVTIDFHCLEGWTRTGEGYRGIRLAALLHLVTPSPAACHVTVASGEYTVTLTREQAQDDGVLLALERDGKPLAAPRLVGPSGWDCFLSVKNVDRIALSATAEAATGPAIALARIGR